MINYIMERQQVGRNTWKKIGEIPGVPTYRDTDVDHGRKYCYRIRAVTAEGTSNVMETDKMQAGKLCEINFTLFTQTQVSLHQIQPLFKQSFDCMTSQ